MATIKLSRRELRGLGILAIGGMIKRLGEERFAVKSEETDNWYIVKWEGGNWTCSCIDYAERKKPCKHIYAVNFLLNLPVIMLSNSDAFSRICPECGSANTRPKGFRYNRSGTVRIWQCKDCKKRFKDPLLSESKGSKTALMIIALDLYFKGLSLRNISDHLWQVYGIKKSPATLHRWINQMTKKLKEALRSINLDAGDRWLADETVVKVNGESMYLWNIMDYETRMYIASLLTSGREAKDAAEAIKEAIRNAGKLPKTLVTDGLQSYRKALQLLGLPINHIVNAGLAKDENNNRMERLNGIVKDWIKRKRGLKGKFKEFIEGYYNFMRPHTALNEKAPAGAKEKLIKTLIAPPPKAENKQSKRKI